MITFEEFKIRFKKKLIPFYFLSREFHSDKLDLFLIQVHDEYTLFIIKNENLRNFDTRFSYNEIEINKSFEELVNK